MFQVVSSVIVPLISVDAIAAGQTSNPEMKNKLKNNLLTSNTPQSNQKAKISLRSTNESDFMAISNYIISQTVNPIQNVLYSLHF